MVCTVHFSRRPRKMRRAWALAFDGDFCLVLGLPAASHPLAKPTRPGLILVAGRNITRDKGVWCRRRVLPQNEPIGCDQQAGRAASEVPTPPSRGQASPVSSRLVHGPAFFDEADSLVVELASLGACLWSQPTMYCSEESSVKVAPLVD